jgi:uncharacterized membrane protein
MSEDQLEARERAQWRAERRRRKIVVVVGLMTGIALIVVILAICIAAFARILPS